MLSQLWPPRSLVEHLRTYQSSVLDLELTRKAEWIYCVVSSLLNEVLKVTDQSAHENPHRNLEEVGMVRESGS